MRIIGIQIYGYGKLENVEIGNLVPNLQIFFGHNEAGKSTLMSFIHSIIFGFPTKHQHEQRYIPKTGTKYGGKLILQTNEYGTITIERLPGKAAGDVSVYLPDGTVKGKDLISELFQGMDKNLYQNVYSFNIHGLQGVHSLKSEDVGRFLFSAGSVGTDALLELQNKLTKEMDGLFKPKGKNPPLNMELIRLKEEQLKVSKMQEKNNEYERLLDEKQRVEQDLINLEARKQYVKGKIQESERLQSIQPILEEYRTLENRLTSLPEFEPFPEDGLKRLDQLQALKSPYEAQMAALKAQSLEWNKEINAIELSVGYLENEQKIVELVENKSLFNEKKNSYNLVIKEIKQVEDEINQLKNQINFALSEKNIFTLNLSMSAKDQFSEIVYETARHKQQKQYLDDSFTQAKEALENSEHRLSSLKKQILPEDKRKDYEKKKYLQSSKDNLEREKLIIEDELKRIDSKITRVSTKELENRIKLTRLFYGFALVLVITAAYFYVSQEWLTGGILTILALLTLPIGRTVVSQLSSSVIDELHEDRVRILKKLENLKEQLMKSNISDDEDVTALLIRDQHVRQQLEIEVATLGQHERTYDKAIAGFEEWEKTGFLIVEKATNIKQTYGLPLQLSNERLLDAFQVLESIREKTLSKQKLLETKAHLHNEISEFQAKLYSVGEQLNILDQSSINVDQLAVRLQEEKEKYEQYLKLETKVEDSTEQISKLTIEIKHLQNEIQDLWDIAQVTSEEAFRAKGKANDAAKELKERMRLLQAQLERFGELVNDCQLVTNYEDLIEDLSTEMEQHHTTEKDLQGQLSSLDYRLQELEEGGTYADFLHAYGTSKSLVKEYAKKWATFAVAKDILSKTVDQYRKLRLPKVVEKAERYFSILTDDRYNRIYIDQEADGFIVEGENGIRYKPNELSQATSEQLYIAIRFSLASTMHPNQSFPFLIDDSFVNFDSQRLSSAISLIKELSKEHQVLLFTCHQHVLEGFGGDSPVLLGKETIERNSKSML